MKYKITKDSAKKWLMASYAYTLSDGFYVVAKLANLPGNGIFHLAAKHIGVAEPIKTKDGMRNKWVNENKAPTDEDAQSLLDFYSDYVKRQDNKSNVDEDVLSRIEEKLDRLLDLWEK